LGFESVVLSILLRKESIRVLLLNLIILLLCPRSALGLPCLPSSF